MKTLSALFGLVFSLSNLCVAQIPQTLEVDFGQSRATMCGHVHRPVASGVLSGRPSAIVRRPYDVLSYDIELDWRVPLLATATTGAARQYRGLNTMRVRVDSANTAALVFDSRSQTIDKVMIDDSEISVAQPTGGILTIPLATPPAQGQELTVRIEYTYTGTGNTGFHLYAKGEQNGSVVERIAYTLGAPDYTRYWLPCNDNAYDKATVRLSVVVPAGYAVACNGLPNTPVDNGDGSFTHVWSDSVPIATYLIVVHASTYRHFADEYKRTDGETIPLLYYVWEPDYEGVLYNAKEKFAPVPAMMQRFAEHYGEYPFSKYGMAVAMPFTYFAMENQTMTTLVRNAINDESTIAHELSHQWLGDFVSPATWNDIWMNEGGATFSEALWAEAQGTDKYREKMDEKRGNYLSANTDGTKQPPCYREIDANPVGNDIYNYATTYAKGAWVYHVLRKLTGDEVFFPMLRSFLQKYAYSTAETEDMVASFEQYIAEHNVVLPVSMRTFFDEWVYKKGHPVYEATAAVGVNNGVFQASVLLKQTQPTQVFSMPVDIVFSSSSGEKIVRTVFSAEREKQETFDLPFLPVSVDVDPDQKILRVVKSAVVTNVADTYDETALVVYPNPATTVLHLSFDVPAPVSGSVVVYNSVGERVAQLFEGVFPSGMYLASWDASNQPLGTYVVQLRAGTTTILRKVCISR